MLIFGQLFLLGFVYGFILKPLEKSKEESEKLNELIASYEGSGSR